MLLDLAAGRDEVLTSLSTAARANPEFVTELLTDADAPSKSAGPGFRVVQSLDPWLPGPHAPQFRS